MGKAKIKPVPAKMDRRRNTSACHRSLQMVCGRLPAQQPPKTPPPGIYICVILPCGTGAGFTDLLLMSRAWQT